MNTIKEVLNLFYFMFHFIYVQRSTDSKVYFISYFVSDCRPLLLNLVTHGHGVVGARASVCVSRTPTLRTKSYGHFTIQFTFKKQVTVFK